MVYGLGGLVGHILYLLVAPAGCLVVVDHAGGLHECVHDGGTHEGHTSIFEVFTEGG